VTETLETVVAPRPDRRKGSHEPIRMLHVITRLIRGGADENTLATVTGLDPRRYLVDLVVGADSELELLRGLDGIGVHVVPQLKREPDPLQDVAALFVLARLIRRNRYQVVHTHTAKGGFLGRIASAMAGTPIIIHTLHGVTFHEHLSPLRRAFYVLLERIAARFTHQFVAVGEDVMNLYLRAGVGRPSVYETIYSGMPLDDYFEAGRMSPLERGVLRARLGLKSHQQAVAMVARLEARKGHVYLFEAVRRLRPLHPHLRVLLVGDGALRPSLEAQCRVSGIADIVRFLGHRHDVARVLAASDISVLTSLWEGLPRVLVQAAATGKPILTFDVEGAWEVVRDGRNGFIVPSRDVDAFTQRLDELLSDRGRALALGEAGRDHVGSQWSVETMLDRLDRLYQRLASRSAA
jgi:glycosyltransferase involved in cell wall biosynthesis